ncbi:TPA: hypothetical protein ACH7QK_005122, partial [Escherichia coli]
DASKIEDFNATTMPASSYFSGDPKTPVTDLPLPPHNATSCQHNMWYLIQLLMTLYVVSSP